MDFTEKTLNSQLIYDGKVVTVYKDDVEIFGGQKSLREVVNHTGGVVILAFKGENILLVRQYRYPLKKMLYELPAGKLEKGEDPFLAAKRELEEETGYCANKWTDLGYVYTSPGYSDEKLHLYRADDLYYTKRNLDDGEILESMECEYTKVLEMIKSGDIADAKTLCAILRSKLL